MAGDKHCPRCRAANPEGAAFCETCGASLAAAGADGAPPDPLLGTVVGDRFLVERRLGEGGMGVVYEAVQTSIGRKVALKVLHPHLADETLYARFRNEAAAASRLAYPNTITVFDFGRTRSGALYIAMELVEGTSLDEEIRTAGALDWQRALRIAAQICGSLEHAHENGIVHRDLKPENVMLLARGSETDVVKVLDFGIAKIVEEEGTDQRQALTKTGMVFGTPQYMSPEQIRGERVDARSDIYSTGVILYRMLTGALPFTAETLMGILTRHLMDPPPPMAQVNPTVQVPAALESLVLQMLAKDPAERPQSMAEVVERMAAQTVPIAPLVPTSPMPPMAPVTEKKGKGGKIAWIALAVLLLGAGGTTAWWFLAGPGRRPPRPAVPQYVMPPIAPPYVAPQYPSAPSENKTAPLPAIPRDTDGSGATDPGDGAGKPKERPKITTPKPKDPKDPEEPKDPKNPEDPGDGDKLKDELISAAKDKLGLLKKKLEEKMKGGKDKDGGT